jgi:hypothetical protein
MKTLTIRISDEEHRLMQVVAARRFMTLTGITRAHFHSLAEQDGLLQHKEAQPEPTKPTVIEPKAQVRKPVEPPTNPYAHLPSVDDVMFDEYPVPEDNPPPDA